MLIFYEAIVIVDYERLFRQYHLGSIFTSAGFHIRISPTHSKLLHVTLNLTLSFNFFNLTKTIYII